MGQFVEDFSGGFPSSIQRLGDVTSDTFDVNGDRARSGAASLLSGRAGSAVEFTDFRIAKWRPKQLAVPRKINYFQFWYNETSNSTGHMLTLVDGDGSVIAGFKGRNPQWLALYERKSKSADPLASSSQTYDRWIRVRISFDWVNYKIAYVIETADEAYRREWNDLDMFKDTMSNWRAMPDGVHGADFWQGNNNNNGLTIFTDSGPQQVWYDDLLLDGPLGAGILSGVVEDESTGDPIAATVRAYNWASGTIEGETTSSSSDGTFTINTVLPGNDYAVTVFPGDGSRPRTHGPITAA